MARVWLQEDADTVNRTTYTFSTVNLGTAAADRYIIVAVASRRASGTPSISSATINGETATVVAPIGSLGNYTAFLIAHVPTGATGDIVFTFDSGMLRAEYAAWEVTGLASATPTDTGTSTAAAPTANIDVVAGGFALGVAMVASTAGTTAWTNLANERADELVESNTLVSVADEDFAGAQSGLAITATFSGTSSPSGPCGSFASWELSGGGGGNRRRRMIICGGAA